MEPVIEDMPVKDYVDGGFIPTEKGLIISLDDAKILSKYLIDLKAWGDSGWYWVQYYIDQLEDKNGVSNSNNE